MPVVKAAAASSRSTNVHRWRACWRRCAASLGLCRAHRRFGALDHPHSRVVGAVDTVDVGRPLIVHRTQENQLRTRRCDTGGIDAEAGRAKPVGRGHQLGSRVFKKFELMVKVIDGADSPALRNPAPDARGEHHNPQCGYQYQQDHSRRSPTPSLPPPINPTDQSAADGGWSEQCARGLLRATPPSPVALTHGDGHVEARRDER
jgi:hypothetical protein